MKQKTKSSLDMLVGGLVLPGVAHFLLKDSFSELSAHLIDTFTLFLFLDLILTLIEGSKPLSLRFKYLIAMLALLFQVFPAITILQDYLVRKAEVTLVKSSPLRGATTDIFVQYNDPVSEKVTEKKLHSAIPVPSSLLYKKGDIVTIRIDPSDKNHSLFGSITELFISTFIFLIFALFYCFIKFGTQKIERDLEMAG